MDDLVGIPVLIATAYQEEKHKYLLVTANLYKAQKIFSMLKGLLPKAKINMFMNDELIRAENLSLSKEMAANRIYALDEILNNKNEIIIANIASIITVQKRSVLTYAPSSIVVFMVVPLSPRIA